MYTRTFRRLRAPSVCLVSRAASASYFFTSACTSHVARVGFLLKVAHERLRAVGSASVANET
jgi:hypothetical protein